MPEMSEKRHDPVGGNGNCSAQKLEHLREKSEQELLDELTQTMKWSDQEVDLDAIDAYLQVLEEKAQAEQKKPEEALAAFKAKHALLLKKVSKKHTLGKTTPAPRQNNNHRILRGLVAAVLGSCFKLYGDRICKRDRHFQEHRTLDKGCFPFRPCSIHRNTVFTNFCNIRYFV